MEFVEYTFSRVMATRCCSVCSTVVVVVVVGDGGGGALVEENAYNGVSAVAKPIQMRNGMSCYPTAACVPVNSLPDTLDE